MSIIFSNNTLLISDLMENLNYFKSMHGDIEVNFLMRDSENALELDQINEGFIHRVRKTIKVCEIRLEEVGEITKGNQND